MRLLPSRIAVSRSRLARSVLATFAVGLFVMAGDAHAVTTQFQPGTLIIPMDTATDGQNVGMLRAYGLVYDLLRHGVPVSWVIDPSKLANGDDFSVLGTDPLEDMRTGAAIAARAYAGGPFLIASTDAATALPFIDAWQAAVGDQTAVHRLVSATPITVDVSRILVTAPRIAVLKDGFEAISIFDLNAARIPDATGSPWSASSPDLLTEAEIAGPTVATHDDGALFHQSSGLPRYCFLASMHYTATATTNEVVQEVRAWLDRSSVGHAFMQCEAARAFENAPGGLYLTTAGLDDDGNPPSSSTVRVPASPLAQIHGAFQADSGAVDSMAPIGSLKTGVTTLINDAASPLTQRIVMMTGRLDGDAQNSRVTYLGGHDYSVDLPISTNPQTNGVRVFLNALFESDCATVQPDAPPTITKTAPTSSNGSQIAYTITYANPVGNARALENIELHDAVPAGTTFMAGSATPSETSVNGGVVTWALPPLAPGAQGAVTFSVLVSQDGTYSNTATLTSSSTAATTVTSPPAVTVRDTVPPIITITGGPGSTVDTTPSFTFTVSAGTVFSLCGIDTPVPTMPCAPEPSAFTAPNPLTPGPHTLYVSATDAAGNTATVSHPFEILTDADGDGFSAPSDCDDGDAAIRPDAVESAGDGVDQNCDGQELCFADGDDDGARLAVTVVSVDVDCADAYEGSTSDPLDCDDANPAAHPGATEVCDSADVDEDCDGVADDADSSVTGTTLLYADADHDGFGATGGVPSLRCEGAAAGGDCDDGNAAIYPDAPEVCTDLVDNDCDASADCVDAECAADVACGPSLCSGGPFTCKSAGTTQFDLRNASNDARDKMSFRWALGDPTTTAELGDPTVDTRYALCVWDDVAGTPTLVMEATAPPAGNCVGRPCWREIGHGKGFRYRDPGLLPTGIDQVTLRTGALGKSRVKVQGRGSVLPDAPMPFQKDPHITVQVVNSLGNCWGAEYVSPARKNTGARLMVKEKP